jgi:hypothetical protein
VALEAKEDGGKRPTGRRCSAVLTSLPNLGGIDGIGDPLPELMPRPSATPSTSASALPTAPALDTPNLPAVPGASAATPNPTDGIGLPAVP